MKKLIILLIVILNIIIQQVTSLNNGLALTPPMGWLSWERYRCQTDCITYPDECINENLYRRVADLLVYEGYKDAGYEYVIVDDCWMEFERDANGYLVANYERFPSGMKNLSDYIHSKGLKFGIYEDFGTKTCAGYPGVIGYMEQDAHLFASWNVDYVKLDGCYAELNEMDNGYPEFGRILNSTGRPMIYSCSWPAYQEYNGIQPNYQAISDNCNLWRNYGDIDDSWSSLRAIAKFYAVNSTRFQPFAGPGHWNDPDMLIIGNFGLSYDQSKVQMALWAILAAPLIMSNNLATVRPKYKRILQNREIIDINQDQLGIQGVRIKYDRNIETWRRPVTPISIIRSSQTKNQHYSYAIAFVSHRTDGSPYPVQVKLYDLGLKSTGGYLMTNLFNNTEKARRLKPSDELKIHVNPTGVEFFKFTVI